MKSYQELIDLLFNSENENLIPDGCAYSEALCDVNDEAIIDRVFLFSIDYFKNIGVGPIAIIDVEIEKGIISSYKSIEKPNAFSIALKSYDKAESARKEYERLYPSIRNLIIKKKLSADEHDVVVQAYNALLSFTNDEMKNVYEIVSKRMFEMFHRELEK
ncbi:MAG: hypothetical protein ACI4C7_08965 [Clostridia bacterium]